VIEKLLLTPEEAAEVLNVGRHMIYDLMRLRVLSSVKIGRCRRIPVGALHEYVRTLVEGDAA
jgi:excisionase family DNA binding protein